jgi:hypothetical protein
MAAGACIGGSAAPNAGGATKTETPCERSSCVVARRACLPSTAIWPWAGVNSHRVMLCPGLIALQRIQDLQKEINQREATIRGYNNRQFPSARARQDAVKVETDGISAARASMKGIQDTLDTEANAAAAAERARQASAEWRNTSTLRAHPSVDLPARLSGLALPAVSRSTALGAPG